MRQDEWFSENIRYGSELGYVMLQLPPIHLPAFNFEGVEYEAKEELHCSLLCIRKLAEAFPDSRAANDAISLFVKEFIKANDILFNGFTNLVYACEDEDAKSIIIGADLHGVELLFVALRGEFPELAALSPPSLHVTLYKYNHRFGIGIHNETQLFELCRPIPFDALPKSIKEQV